MQNEVFCSRRNAIPTSLIKKLLVMKLFAVFMLAFCLQAGAFGYGQKVTLTAKNASLKSVLTELKKQTGYLFFYNDAWLTKAKLVSIQAKDLPLTAVLEQCFSDQPFNYAIVEKTIVISEKPEQPKQEEVADSTITITGTVLSATTGQPLNGATVTSKNGGNSTTTNADGHFKIQVTEGDQLLISFVGHENFSVAIGKNHQLSISLQEKPNELNATVVVGYRTVKKGDLTGAITAIGTKDFNVGVVTSPTELMQGRLAGVSTMANGGEPGAGIAVRVRGSNSVRSGQDPLYVVDGVPLDITDLQPEGGSVGGVGGSARKNPLNFLNPDDIESIAILKDASAAAIYGSRGSNGVIMITTKKGKKGKGQLAYSGYVGFSELPKQLPMLSAEEFRTFRKANGATTGDMGANTNWQDEIFRTAVSQNHSLSFGGGSDNTSYRASLSYMNQEGIIRKTGLDKVTARVNVAHAAFNNKLKLEANLTTARTNDQRVPIGETGGYEGDVLLSALKVNPTFPVYNTDGSFYQYSKDVRNPVAMIELTNDKTQTDRILGNISATLNLFKGFSYKVNVGVSNSKATRKVTQNKQLIYLTNYGTANVNDVTMNSSLIENFITYDFNAGKSSKLNVLAGHSYQKFNNYVHTLSVDGFTVEGIDYLNELSFGNYTRAIVSSDISENALQSFFGRVNYDLADKYLFTATLRADGSTKFGENNKYGFFPSASFAWKLSKEKFMENFTALSDLKVRLSWGITGNQEIPNKISQVLLGTTGGAILDGSTGNVVAGITLNRTPNPDIRWEKTEQLNLGVDFSFLRNRFTGSIDVFNKKTTDVLLQVYSIAPAPTTSVWTNVDNMSIINKGLEMVLNGTLINNRNFTWDAGVNFTTIRNEVKNLPMSRITTGSPSGPGITGYSSQVIMSGEPIGTFWGRKFLGFDASGNSLFEKDKDGKEFDQVLGNAMPKFNYGFNTSLRYKQLDLAMFFNGVYGNKVYNNTGNILDQRTLIMKEWNATKDAITLPENLNGTLTYSSRFIEPGSFFRLGSASLGYRFNTAGISWMKSLKAYVSANNLFVITKYKGYDPEVNADHASNGVPSIGIDWTTYPKARTITAGVNVEF